jgi:TnsA endonuclease C terminal/TnsA endonuclease N terminal
VLGEVKHSSYLQKYEEEYAQKFAAALRYCEEHNWAWRIFTEKEIRTPYLDNLKFLREYRSTMPDQILIDQVVNYLQNARDPVSVESLLLGLCETENDQLYLVPTIWQLITVKRIAVNLQVPLTMKSKLSLSKETSP